MVLEKYPCWEKNPPDETQSLKKLVIKLSMIVKIIHTFCRARRKVREKGIRMCS